MTGGFGANDFIIGSGEFEAGESISGGFGGGSDRLLVSGTNNFLIGTVSGIDYVIGSAGSEVRQAGWTWSSPAPDEVSFEVTWS